MNDGDALMRAILLSPNDDAPRLVMADYLDEHDDPLRAEFIRVQCELASTKDGRSCKRCGGKICIATVANSFPVRLARCIKCGEDHGLWRPDELFRRQLELWHQMPTAKALVPHGFKLESVDPNKPVLSFSHDGCPLPKIDAGYQRGFITAIMCMTSYFMRSAKRLFRQCPIESVVLSDKRPGGGRDYAGRPVEAMWHLDNLTRIERSLDQNPETRLPEELMLLLDGGTRAKFGTTHYYPTLEEANDALSRACVKLGRMRAGLEAS